MFPIKHIIYGAIFSLTLYIFSPYSNFIPFLIIFLSSVLIDIDHYFIYAFRKKDKNFFRSYKWHVNLKYNKKELEENTPFPHFFHSFEFFVLLVILSFYNLIFIYITIGFLFHSLLDIFYMKKTKFLKNREFFMIRWLIRQIRK